MPRTGFASKAGTPVISTGSKKCKRNTTLSMSSHTEIPVERDGSSGRSRHEEVKRQEVATGETTVTNISTPDDGTCGIGTYAGDLSSSFDDVVSTETLTYDQDDRSAVHFLELAVRAMLSGSDIIHVQHEYGLFRREDSPWPGIMGLVFFPVLFALNGFFGKTIVVTMHSVLMPEPDEAPTRIRLYLVVMHELIAAGADHLIFLSEGCADRFCDDVDLGPGEYSVLPHGVNVSEASDLTREESKARLGYDADDTVVMIPGFIRPPKGHDLFVDVARELPQYEFLVAGGGRPKGDDLDYARRIEEEAPENVTVTGVLDGDEFADALNAADLAFLPYRVVTQSGTFNWCAAHAIPVVASDEPYFTRLKEEWGCVETLSLEDRDAGAIADRIQRLLDSDGRREVLAENMRRYRRHNSFERVAEMHYRIYKSPSSATGVDVEAEPVVAKSTS